MLTAMAIDIPGNAVEFPRDRTHDQARHFCNSENSPAATVVQLILAGPIVQAIRFPKSIDPEVVDWLITPSLFSRGDCMTEGSETVMELAVNGFEGDWRRLKQQWDRVQGTETERRLTLGGAHQSSLDRCRSAAFNLRLDAALADLRIWLAEDDRDLIPQALVLYRERRVIAACSHLG